MRFPPLADGWRKSRRDPKLLSRAAAAAVAAAAAANAAAVTAADAGDGDEFARLLAWAQRGVDAHVPPADLAEVPRISDVLGIRSSGEERVVVAKRDVKSGELLLRIPMQLLMHAGYYKLPGSSDSAAPTGGTLSGPGVSSQLAPAMHAGLSGGRDLTTFVAPQTWLALYLMEHRRLGASSEWSPYLDLVPRKFPTNPVFFGDEEWRWLEGSTFRGRAFRHKESLRTQFETVKDLVPGLSDNYTLEDFVWARTAISSRVFGWTLPGISTEDTDFMVPLGDMFNHRSPKQIEWFFNDTLRTLDYRAKEDVPLGGELLISYGGKCNSQYLLHYGFALPNIVKRQPPLSSVRVPLQLDADVPDRDAREQWLVKSKMLPKGEPLPPEEFEVRATWKGSGAQNMLAYARLLSIPAGDDFDRTLKSRSCRVFASPPRCDSPLSLDNERAALKRCLAAFRLSLAAYPTSLEEDEAMLGEADGRGGDEGSPRLLAGVPRFLVLLRRDEKAVLRWWVRFFEIALEATELSAEAIEEKADHEFGRFDPEGRYLRITLAALATVEGSTSKAPEL